MVRPLVHTESQLLCKMIVVNYLFAQVTLFVRCGAMSAECLRNWANIVLKPIDCPDKHVTLNQR